jgi:hypothetical protein
MAAVLGHIDVEVDLMAHAKGMDPIKVGTVTVPVSVHATEVGGYSVPIDPMDDNQCEACQ